jgi:hypothetical protein
LYQVEKFTFLGVLENNEDVTARINELEVFYNVWVVEPTQHLYLAFHFLEDTL